MKFEEALKLLKEGKKIRNKLWRKEYYIWTNVKVCFLNPRGDVVNSVASDLILNDDWEEYKE